VPSKAIGNAERVSFMMKKNRTIFIAVILVTTLAVFIQKQKPSFTQPQTTSPEVKIISGAFDKSMAKTNDEWKKILTPEQYHILREAGTEIPFTGILNNEKRKGTYYSVGCNKPLFRSEQKYDSGTGWPSFWTPIRDDVVVLRQETAFGDDRIEVLDTCGGHLGHVFNDGPKPTGKRYCMNSIALRFVPDNN
jgi:peptide-methionine (R)-S-oxide reductase